MAFNRYRFSPLLVAAGLLLFATAPRAASRGEPWAGRPLVDALERLRDDGLRLVYSSELVPERLTVLDNPTSREPRRILEELLAPYGLAVSEGPGGTLLVVRGATPAPGRVLGRVHGSGDYDPPASRVIIAGRHLEVRADPDGNYAMSLPPGRYNLTFSAPGFITRPVDGVVVRPGADTRLDVRVSPLEIVHETIRVTADEQATGPTEERIGLDRETLDLAPSLVEDPYEVVGRLPGVTASETTAGLNVRGGRGDELLVLFDGLEIQDPFHVKDIGGGLLSAFDSTTIGSIDYLGGAFPAQYGNRVSGVLEMATTMATAPSEGTLTLTNGLFRAASRGTFGRDGGEWLVSGRAGDPELLVSNFVAEEVYQPHYYDVLAKVVHQVGSRTTLASHMLVTYDTSEQHGSLFDEGEVAPETGVTRSRYDSAFAWLTADTVWSASLWSRTVLAWGASEVERSVLDVIDVAIRDDRDYDFVEIKQDWRAVPHDRHHLRWGFGTRWEKASYDYESELDSPGGPAAPWSIETSPSGIGYSLYFSDTFRAHPSLLLEFGLRHDGETYTGRDDSVTSPRFNLAWSFGTGTTLRAGWGRYHQFHRPFELNVEDGDAAFYPVETSEHRQVNLERRFSDRFTARIGVYEKSQHGVRPWFENLFDPFSLAPEAQPDRVRVAPERALARGVELALQGGTGFGLDWSASYAYANADDTVDGREELRLWDQHHTVELGLIYLVNHRWELGFTGNWHSGRPTTAVEGSIVTDPERDQQVVASLGPRNGERYAVYSRIDVRAARRFRLGATGFEVFANVANLLGRNNVCCTIGFDFTIEPDDSVTTVPLERTGLDRTLSLGMTWSF